MKLLIFGLLLKSVVTQTSECLNDEEVLSQILKSAGDLNKQPNPVGEEEEKKNFLQIGISLHVNFFNIVPHTSSLEIDGLITREWKHPSLYYSHLKPCHASIRISSLKHKLWVPPLAFVNAIDITLHSHSTVIHLKEDGTIIHTERIRQNVPCKTAAKTYPFGNTTCTLIWRSDDFTKDTAKIYWKETNLEGHEFYHALKMLTFCVAPPLRMDFLARKDEVEFVDFADIAPLHILHEPWTRLQTSTQMAGDLLLKSTSIDQHDAFTETGVQDELFLNFTFMRGANKIFFLFYIPSIIFMVIPWLSLLLGPMAITRCIMNMVSLVLISLHYMANMAGLPETNGITAIDIWKVFSLIFILSIVFELVIVTLMASLGRSRRFCSKRKNRKGKYEMEPLYEEMNDLRERKTRKTCGCCRVSALILDMGSFVFFSILFAGFSIAYYYEKDVIVQFLNDFNLENLKFL